MTYFADFGNGAAPGSRIVLPAVRCQGCISGENPWLVAPEPSTSALLGLGAVALWLVRRRTKSARRV